MQDDLDREDIELMNRTLLREGRLRERVDTDGD